MSQPIMMGEKAGRELCDILGIDSNQVKGILIDLRPGNAVEVSVKFVLTHEQWSRIGESLRVGRKEKQ